MSTSGKWLRGRKGQYAQNCEFDFETEASAWRLRGGGGFSFSCTLQVLINKRIFCFSGMLLHLIACLYYFSAQRVEGSLPATPR